MDRFGCWGNVLVHCALLQTVSVQLERQTERVVLGVDQFTAPEPLNCILCIIQTKQFISTSGSVGCPVVAVLVLI